MSGIRECWQCPYGRLWQTMILTRWSPLFTDIPVESLVHEYQAEYDQALQKSTHQTDSAPFIEFMLRMILGVKAVFFSWANVKRLIKSVKR